MTTMATVRSLSVLKLDFFLRMCRQSFRGVATDEEKWLDDVEPELARIGPGADTV